jgi:hypothetical protein
VPVIRGKSKPFWIEILDIKEIFNVVQFFKASFNLMVAGYRP